MIEMVNIVPSGACPKCGHKQFVVLESQLRKFLTNADGETIDHSELDYNAEGMCCNCNSVFKMMPTWKGFIPLTRLREIMFDYSPHALEVGDSTWDDVINPMEAIE